MAQNEYGKPSNTVAPSTGYGISAVPLHAHTGSDNSLKVAYKNLLGAPNIPFVGSVAVGGSSVFLPSGWSSTRSATGIYVVTHNLMTTTYVVNATAISSGPIADATWAVIHPPTKTTITIEFISFNIAGGVAINVNTDFNFMLQIAN